MNVIFDRVLYRREPPKTGGKKVVYNVGMVIILAGMSTVVPILVWLIMRFIQFGWVETLAQRPPEILANIFLIGFVSSGLGSLIVFSTHQTGSALKKN